MEPLLALSLAANIAQFVELSSKIIHGTKELGQSVSGMTKEDLELKSVTESMRRISLILDPPSSKAPSDDEEALRRLAADCRILSKQLLDLLEKRAPKDSTSRRHIVISAFKHVLTQREKAELERRLDSCRSQLELQLQFMTRSVTPELLCSTRLTANSSDTMTKLVRIGSSADRQVELLRVVHQHVEELTQGAKVVSISKEAQEQIRQLLELSQKQREALVQSHILKAVAIPDPNARFDDVGGAHHDTFRWMFPSQKTVPKVSLQPESIDEYGCINSSQQLSAGPSTVPVDTEFTEPDSSSSNLQSAQGWSVWQLDDGYEEENQDWWYKERRGT
jgi:hypothetical protein